MTHDLTFRQGLLEPLKPESDNEVEFPEQPWKNIEKESKDSSGWLFWY